MSTRKKKEHAAKKQKNFKANEVSEIECIDETIPEDISSVSLEPQDTKETEENLLEKERQHATHMEERFLRVNAEFENYKKRIIKENSDRFKFFNLDLIKELLPSLDNLERAITHAKNENKDFDSMIEGLEMVNKMTHEVFEKFGVSRVNTVGEVFDPNIHQAVGLVQSDSVPENHVVEECLAGYILHDRIIRPAMVRVSGKN